MQIIAISRGSQSYGEAFARRLAANLGCLCIGREEILEEATRRRIAIGRLETAMIKPHTFSEELALELEHYKALATSILCEKALSGPIVYHGRTGHLLLPGIDHILKIRVIADLESRIEVVVRKFGLSRAKARQYIEKLDQDRKRWVKQFYHVDWEVSSLYDLVLNLSSMHVENAALAACSMAQLPEFQCTPAGTTALRNLYLASRSRLVLATDRRTAHLNVKVRAGEGVVYVTHLGKQAKEAGVISDVLKQVGEAKEVVCTEAETNILWIQETFDPKDTAYNDVLRLATTWDAAVELLQITPSDTLKQFSFVQDLCTLCGTCAKVCPEGVHSVNGDHRIAWNLCVACGTCAENCPQDALVLKGYSRVEEAQERGTESWRETGIMEDEEQPEQPDEGGGMSRVYEKLINDGHAGGKRVVRGSQRVLLHAVDRSIPYRMIVLDKMFASKGHATQTRLVREWSNFLGDHLKIPVLSIEEIRSRYRFGAREFTRMAFFAGLTAFVAFLVFHFDREILSFLSREGFGWRVLATLGIFALVPFFAYVYSTATRLFFKMLKFE